MPHFILALVCIIGLVALELDRRRQKKIRAMRSHHLAKLRFQAEHPIVPAAKRAIQIKAAQRRASETVVHVSGRFPAITGRVAITERLSNGNS